MGHLMGQHTFMQVFNGDVDGVIFEYVPGPEPTFFLENPGIRVTQLLFIVVYIDFDPLHPLVHPHPLRPFVHLLPLHPLVQPHLLRPLVRY